MSYPRSRRNFLGSVGAITTTVFAGCKDFNPSAEGPNSKSTEGQNRSSRTATEAHSQTDIQTESDTPTETPTETETPDGQPPTHLVRTTDLAALDIDQESGYFADVVAGDEGVVCGGHVDGDIWLVKFDTNLDLEWSRTYSGWEAGRGRDGVTVNVASDGGFLVGGIPQTDTDEVGVFKTGPRGDIQWDRLFEARSGDNARNVWFVELAESNFVCAWTVYWAEGAETHIRGFEGSEGPVQWRKDDESLATKSVRRTHDGSWFLYGSEIGGGYVMQQFRLDGAEEWRANPETFYRAVPTPAGYVLWGTRKNEVRVRALDHDRQEQWTRTYEQPGIELDVLEPNGSSGYLLASEGDEGVWLTSIGPDGDVQSDTKYGVEPDQQPEPLGLISADEQYVVVGRSTATESTNRDGWVLSVDK